MTKKKASSPHAEYGSVAKAIRDADASFVVSYQTLGNDSYAARKMRVERIEADLKALGFQADRAHIRRTLESDATPRRARRSQRLACKTCGHIHVCHHGYDTKGTT